MTWRVEPDQDPDLWKVVCDAPLGMTVTHGIESPGSPVLSILYPSQWQAQRIADQLNDAAEDADG